MANKVAKPVIYSFLSPPPSRPYKFPNREYRAHYREIVGRDGLKRLEVSETYNFYEMVQAYADTVDIYSILERCGRGDYAGLHSRPVVFGDITEVPTDLASILAIGQHVQQLFDQLPDDVKAFYKNDFNVFLARADKDILRSQVETSAKMREESAHQADVQKEVDPE